MSESENYDPDWWMFKCRVCGTDITSCELCEECAKDNDPFPDMADDDRAFEHHTNRGKS